MVNTKIFKRDALSIAVVESADLLIYGRRSVLDFLEAMAYATDCNGVAVSRDAVADEFFKMRNGIGRGVLDTVKKHTVKFAVYGDFSEYEGRDIQKFIRQCNESRDIIFASDEGQAVKILFETCKSARG